jgi:DNA-binding NarL/FixJ family response regulator
VKKVQVLVANRPRLMRDVVLETLSEQPDIEIVGEVGNEEDILEAVEKVHPDCLIIGLDQSGQRPRLCDSLLEKHPNIRILAVSPESNRSAFYWASLDIHSNPVETSQEGILNALRGGLLAEGVKP